MINAADGIRLVNDGLSDKRFVCCEVNGSRLVTTRDSPPMFARDL
jgi:hypothetical protein